MMNEEWAIKLTVFAGQVIKVERGIVLNYLFNDSICNAEAI